MAEVRTRAVVTLEEPDHVVDVLLEHMKEHAKVKRTANGARISNLFAKVDITRDGPSVLLDVTAMSPTILGMVKVFVAEHIFEFATGVPSIVWLGDGAADPLPPQFQELTVSSALDLTPRMRRVVFSCADAARYAGNAGYHVRLLLPPHGRPPIWPSLSADGRMDWPAGENTLVSRVYTVREVNARENMIAVDFVLHDGDSSPGANFARNAVCGQKVGALGPGGDGCPQARNLLLLGDEAALPAIARMLENIAQDTRAHAFIEVEDEADEQVITSPGLVEIVWLHRRLRQPGAPEALMNALTGMLESSTADDLFVWAGCEQRVATQLRDILKARLPRSKAKHRVYGYWSRNDH